MASMFDVYITKTGKFLPNDPVSNDRMEDYLGRINDAASKARRLVLKKAAIMHWTRPAKQPTTMPR